MSLKKWPRWQKSTKRFRQNDLPTIPRDDLRGRENWPPGGEGHSQVEQVPANPGAFGNLVMAIMLGGFGALPYKR